MITRMAGTSAGRFADGIFRRAGAHREIGLSETGTSARSVCARADARPGQAGARLTLPKIAVQLIL
jgi:hypothetical protein